MAIGTKLILWPGVSANAYDIAVGVSTGMWFSGRNTTDEFDWFVSSGGGSPTKQTLMTLYGTGKMWLNPSRQAHADYDLTVYGTTAKVNIDGSTSNWLALTGQGYASPSFTTRSIGTKVVLWPAVGAADVDFALGIDAASNWYSVPRATAVYAHKFYGGTTPIAIFYGDGSTAIGVGSYTSTQQFYAYGAYAQAGGQYNYAIGGYSGNAVTTNGVAVMALGFGVTCLQMSTVSIGLGFTNPSSGTVAIGNGAVGWSMDGSQNITQSSTTVNGSLTTTGGRFVPVLSVASAAGTTVIGASDHFVCVTGSLTQILTLPAAANGRWLLIKNRSSVLITINRAGSDTIDGGTTYSLAAGGAIMLLANSTDWCVN